MSEKFTDISAPVWNTEVDVNANAVFSFIFKSVAEDQITKSAIDITDYSFTIYFYSVEHFGTQIHSKVMTKTSPTAGEFSATFEDSDWTTILAAIGVNTTEIFYKINATYPDTSSKPVAKGKITINR